MSVAVRFLPWVRTGLAARLPAHTGHALPARGTVRATVRVDGVAVTRDLHLHGPGAVIGFAEAEVVREEPRDRARDFEGNYFPFVELASPDLPWRYTPVGADQNGRLRPWLVLVVVEQRDGVRIESSAGSHSLVIDDGADLELPDLSESWAWAHVQLDDEAEDLDALAAVLAKGPSAARARLLCPRRLRPETDYLAVVVPAFQQGVDAAFGRDPEALGDHLVDAWTGSAASVRLPAYHWWRFHTTEDGDFEALVRRLQPTLLPDDTGVRRLDLEGAGEGLPEVGGAATRYFGGLRAPDAVMVWEPDAATETAFGDALQDVAAQSDESAEEPVVGPPTWGDLYGDWDAPWVATLNRHPTWRAVASLGAATVRANQEKWVARAWEIAGDLRTVQGLVNQARFAVALGRTLGDRVSSMGDDALVTLGRGLQARTPSSTDNRTVGGALRASPVPDGLERGSVRRISRSDGVLRRSLRRGPVVRGSQGELARRVRTGSLDLGVTTTFVAAPNRMVLNEDAFGGELPASAVETLDSVAAWRTGLTLSPVFATSATAVAPRTEVDTAASQAIVAAASDLREGITTDEVVARVEARVAGFETLWTPGALPRRIRVPLEFQAPLSPDLIALDPDWLLPGAGELPLESIGMLEADPRFVEAFLAGANHEIRRELRWRGFPASAGTAPFLGFWEKGLADVRTLADWTGDLGENAAEAREVLVLVVRGALVRRYPDAIYEVVPATWTDEGGSTRRVAVEGAEAISPVFSGLLGEDILYVGFPIGEVEARGHAVRHDPDEALLAAAEQGEAGWFVRISERPVGPRFGLDVEDGAADPPPPGVAWNADDLSWAHLEVGDSGFAPVTTGPLAGDDVDAGGVMDPWGETAAVLARQTSQRPVRVLVHCSHLLPEVG